jgi:hypothetical protein
VILCCKWSEESPTLHLWWYREHWLSASNDNGEFFASNLWCPRAAILHIKQSTEFRLSIVNSRGGFYFLLSSKAKSRCQSFQMLITPWQFEQNLQSLLGMPIRTKRSALTKKGIKNLLGLSLKLKLPYCRRLLQLRSIRRVALSVINNTYREYGLLAINNTGSIDSQL